MYIFIGLGVLVIIALLGWGIAELKYKHCVYTISEEEIHAEEEEHLHHPKQSEEMGIRDIVKTISTKGFKTV